MGPVSSLSQVFRKADAEVAVKRKLSWVRLSDARLLYSQSPVALRVPIFSFPLHDLGIFLDTLYSPKNA